jgi:hypothetical protein
MIWRDPTYRQQYTRGWRASQRGARGTLDRADERGEPPAWYDGYLDYASGREKWHLPLCREHRIPCGEHRW